MASIVADRLGYLLVQFYYQRRLCREYLKLRDTRDNRRVAQQKAHAIEIEIKSGRFDYAARFPDSKRLRHIGINVATEPPTLGAYARQCLGLAELSKATKYDYEALFRRFLDRTDLGAKRLDAVGRADIATAVVGAGKRRVTMFLQRLRWVYDNAIDDGFAAKNPAERVKNPRGDRRELPEPFSEAERRAILAEAKGQDRNLISVLLETGIRPGEALALRRQDVDLKRRRLVVSGSLGRFGEGPTKTVSVRIVELSESAAAALREQMRVINPRVFRNGRGGPLSFVNWRHRSWRTILTRAKVAYRSPYALRHTYAVAMLERHHDPVYIAKQMGHTSTAMLHRHYGRWILRPEQQQTL
ncbi:MAG TPA: tyrosine-type recombinase/integrase [Candidatus Binataceae bacterium]|nr:tyrosine-type recombinase/integrase [Candidatus Binataceae bacterium]